MEFLVNNWLLCLIVCWLRLEMKFLENDDFWLKLRITDAFKLIPYTQKNKNRNYIIL